MREIKFRAWDIENKCWYDEFTLTNDGYYINQQFNLAIDKPYIKLMQFTGLKDKNGKEIYEGDLVEITNTWTTFRRECKFIESTFGFMGSTGNAFIPIKEYMKIIGNIYENPELLEETCN